MAVINVTHEGIKNGSNLKCSLLQVIQLDNLWCIMLPPNATTLIQPLDQGIIAMVKARYRKWFLSWILNQDAAANEGERADADSDAEDAGPVIGPDTSLAHIKPSIRRGIRHLSDIWSGVQPRHITACSRRAGIVPAAWTPTAINDADALEQEYVSLQPLIERVAPDPHRRMNAMEFVHDVVGENEREDVNSDEGPSSTKTSPQTSDGQEEANDEDEDGDVLCSQPDSWPVFESQF